MAFFVRLPDRLRWDFFRFLVLIPAFTTWMAATRLWFGVVAGTARLPTGTIFGGAHDSGGDINRLMNEYGWSSGSLVAFGTTFATLTGVMILATYMLRVGPGFIARQDPRHLHADPDADEGSRRSR